MKRLISICIPAYKNTDYLQVLLESVAIQSFKDYEVVVSDDSPGDEVEVLCRKYAEDFSLIYHKNIPAKGSPANWNAGICMATGQWIKIMHDDDWFSSPDSLNGFAKAAAAHPEASFLFSGFNHFEDGRMKERHIIGKHTEEKLRRSPLCLFSKNYIGHPSTTMIKNELREWYDEKVKWVVDFEFYIRCLRHQQFHFIAEPLVNIGINNEQITKAVFRNPAVEIPENIYLLNTLGVEVLRDMTVYDYYWRMFRNLGIRSVKTVEAHLGDNTLPAALISMLHFQLRIPPGILKQGIFSKPLMALSYFTNNKKQ